MAYLHLLTDAFSRKILGWTLAPSLEARHTLAAFDMAAREAAAMGADFRSLIHHSDRGVQYCCTAYVSRLLSLGVRISMTEGYKPTDNAVAERVNGILKQLFINGQTLTEMSDAYNVLSRGIAFYNDVRPHSSVSNLPLPPSTAGRWRRPCGCGHRASARRQGRRRRWPKLPGDRRDNPPRRGVAADRGAGGDSTAREILPV